MKLLRFMKDQQKRSNLSVWVLVVLIAGIGVWGIRHGTGTAQMDVSDGIQRIDLDTIYLEASRVEVDFSEVILSEQKESRKLMVSTQTGTVITELTDRLIEKLDFGFLKKTQSVSYTGTGHFVVDLDRLTAANVIQDKERRTVTIRIGHPYLEVVEINPNDILIDEVKEGLLARGDIKLTVADYNAIEKELRTRLVERFDTVENGQNADDLALKMVREVYEPIVKAIDRRYEVVVVFKA